jgi:hypothetical protein
MAVPEAGFSAFAALTALAVNVRRHWQRAHDDDEAAVAYLLLERRRPLSASSSVRDDDDDMACGAPGGF